MKNYVLQNGTEVTEQEMSAIHEHYEIECTTEYILDNYANIDEDTARMLASKARDKMQDYCLSEEAAVKEIIEAYEYGMED